MYKRLWMIVTPLLLGLLFGGVSSASAQVVESYPFGVTDWCYQFNFLTNQHQAQFFYGDWESGTGYKTEDTGATNLLTVFYEQSLTAAPVGVEWRFNRGAFTGSTAIDVTASLDAFGVEHVPDPLLFTFSPEEEFKSGAIAANSADDFDNSFTVSLSATEEIAVTSLTVWGNGINPFPFNHCGPATMTPVPGTATATGTATAAPTSTQGACLLPGQPSPTPTGGATPTPTVNVWSEDFDGTLDPWGRSFSATLTGSVSSANGANTTNPAWGDNVLVNNAGENFRHAAYGVVFPAAVTIHSVTYKYLLVPQGSASQEASISMWTGAAPSAGEDWENSDWSFESGRELATWTTKTKSSGFPANVYAVSVWAMGYSGAEARTQYVDEISISYSFVQQPPTPWPNCTATPTITPSVSPTMTPSRTPTPTSTPFTLTPTFTATPSRTPFPIIIPTTAPTRTPAPTNTAGPPTATLDPSITPTGTVGALVPPDNDNDGNDPSGRGLGNGFLALASNLWQRTQAWLGNVSDGISSVTDAWNTAEETAPPNMPRCRTDPLENELCAIWYILTFTVFGGTIGNLIITLAIAAVDLYFLLEFIRRVKAIYELTKQIRSGQ